MMRVMSFPRRFVGLLALIGALLVVPVGAAERFTATAAVKNTSGGASTTPLTIVVDKFSTAAERESLLKALREGNTTGRDLLAKRPTVGSVQIGGRSTPIKYAYAVSTGDQRLITVVTGSPIGLDGAGSAAPATQPGFDLGLVLLELPSSGAGTGDLVAATKIRVERDNSIVTENASPDLVKLSNVTVGK
jgi:hypothetical protein